MLNKEERKKQILKENFIYYKDATKEDLVMLGMEKFKNEEVVYFFDTENAPIFSKEIVEKYNLDKIEYREIEEFKASTDEEEYKESLMTKLLKAKQVTTQIYVWQFGANNSDRVFWGNTIEEFLEFVHSINIEKIEGSSKGANIKPFVVYVHNLKWDIEFFKYYFQDQEYKQLRRSQNKEEINKNKQLNKVFDITETDGIVHNALIQYNKTYIEKKYSNRKNAKVYKYDFLTTIDFRDSYKITSLKLEAIAKNVIKVDEIFIKDSDNIKYDLVRDPKTYIPTINESWYIYCDIYLLKEWYNQFVFEMYLKEGIKPYTISQISIESIMKKTFEKIDRSLYCECGEDPSKVKDRTIYENHFYLNYVENNKKLKEIFRSSYMGGHTTASPHFKRLSEKNRIIKGVSMDITSSYPSQMCLKPLPYGKPRYYEGKPIFDLIDNNDNKTYDYHIVTIAFDGFISKNPENQFGLNIKLKGLTEEQKALLDTPTNESALMNLVNGEFIGENKPNLNSLCEERRELIKPYHNHNFIVTVHYEELKEWLKDYRFFTITDDEEGIKEDIIYIDTVSQKSEIGFFKEGIMYYYNLKDKADIEGNEALKLNAKLIINSFYGKHCSKRRREQRFYDFDKDIISFQAVTTDNLNEWEDKKLYAMQYGSAVTSWGRIQLRKTVRILGSDKFIYADTDSIKMNYDKTELKKRVEAYNNKCEKEEDKLFITGININKKELGSWDFEFSMVDFKVVGQKKYMYKIEGSNSFKVKCCGLPDEIRKTIKTKEEFSIGNTFIKRACKKVIGGNIIIDIPYSLNELIKY